MSDVVIYEDGNVSLELSVEDKTIWLDANDIASIFDVNRPAIVKHIANNLKDFPDACIGWSPSIVIYRGFRPDDKFISS